MIWLAVALRHGSLQLHFTWPCLWVSLHVVDMEEPALVALVVLVELEQVSPPLAATAPSSLAAPNLLCSLPPLLSLSSLHLCFTLLLCSFGLNLGMRVAPLSPPSSFRL